MRSRNTEPIPVEIIETASVTKLEKPAANKSEGSTEAGNDPLDQKAAKPESTKINEDQAKKPEASSPQSQSEQLKTQEKPAKHAEDLKDAASDSSVQGTPDQPHQKEDKPVRKEAKTASKSRAPKVRTSSKQDEHMVSQKNRQKEVEATVPLPETPPRTNPAKNPGQVNTQSSYPNIPFDPEVFRAVAVPLPSPGGGEPVSYKEIVFGLLERAKHYPEAALARGAKGRAIVEFMLDSTGDVIQRSLLESSGDPDLDAESLELLLRASPFPPPPLGAQHSFSAEIGFGLVRDEP